MIVFLPLVPIIIAICLLGLSLADGLAGSMNTITTIVWVLMIIIAVISFVIKTKLDYPKGQKKKELTLLSISHIFTFGSSYLFFQMLNHCGNDLGDLIGLIFILLILGSTWLFMATSWLAVCFMTQYYDDEDFNRCLLTTVIVGIILFAICRCIS